MWYIHPYTGQDEGMSWATIDKTGNWFIVTEKRKFISKSIAALVVDSSIAEDAPPRVGNIKRIRNHAMIIYTKEEMKNNGWYEKL